MAQRKFFPSSLTKVTLFSRCMALFLLILFPFAGFYIGMNYQRIQDEKAMQIAQATLASLPTPTPIPAGKTLNLGLSDSGKTFYVSLGSGIVVNLSTKGIVWSVRSSDASILRSFAMGIAQKAGEPAITRFTAVKKGTAQIIGEGTAACKSAQPCPQFLMRFNVDIIVEYP